MKQERWIVSAGKELVLSKETFEQKPKGEEQSRVADEGANIPEQQVERRPQCVWRG